jgi:hypothetical protein
MLYILASGLLSYFAKRNPHMNIRLILSGLAAFAALYLIPATGSGSQIFVANQGPLTGTIGNGTIGVYTTSGATVNSALVSGLDLPFGIALSGGNLFVAGAKFISPGNWTIGKYNATTRATVNSALVSGLATPTGLALSEGNLFVSQLGGVGEYTTSGATVNSALVSGLFAPNGIAVSGGKLFVADTNTFTIGVYNAITGATVNSALVSGVIGVFGIAVSGNNLFVVNDDRIGVYNATTGAPINPAFISGLDGPAYLALSGGSLFVTSIGSFPFLNGTIGEYNATTGAPVNSTLISGLDQPAGIVVATPTSVPDASSSWTLLLLGLTATLGLKPLLRRAA